MHTSVKPDDLTLLSPITLESGKLILRDGSMAKIRAARPDDRDDLSDFFNCLSTESRHRRFFSSVVPRPELVASFCESRDPHARTTLIVTRTQGSKACIIATGSYLAKDERTAEVSFAVADSTQGNGLGTLLLEQLALLAIRQGFTRFWAITHAENLAMREVFRESGFVFEERPDRGEIEVDLSIVPNETSVARMETRHRLATVTSLRPFFYPSSVAVIGASRNPSSIGYRILDTIVRGGFSGSVYPVNSKATEVRGLQTYQSVVELPETPDLAIVAVPRAAVLGVVDDCAKRGVRAVVVIAAGFAEVGVEGQEFQRQLVERVRGYGMRLIGPNCLGLLSTGADTPLYATFASVFPRPGRVAMSSDSGGLGLAVLATATRLELGISSFISVGNRADVSNNDLLEYWEEDDATDVILLYMESFGNPRRFARIARRVSRRKPIVVVKSGRTKGGSRAAGSHTAALAASDVAVDALFHQTGVVRAESLEELFDLAVALGSQPLPSGRRVAILTNAGGPAILCADACEAAGLALGELSETTKSQLRTFLPATASLGNPVDMIASATATDFGRAVQTILGSSQVDALIAIYVNVGGASVEAVTQAIQESVVAARKTFATHQPVLVCRMPDQVGLSLVGSGDAKLPCYAFPEAPARVLGKMAAYSQWRTQPLGKVPDFDGIDLRKVRSVCREALRQRGTSWLSAEETRLVLQAMRLPTGPGGVAGTPEEAVAIARDLGFPVAEKLASCRLVHKTEIGGVHLNLSDEEMVRQAFETIRSRLVSDNNLDAMEGVLVQPMVTGGTEVMIGMTQDPVFGPLIAFGLGGIHVEILGDVCFRVTPLTDCDASEMVRGIRGYRLLQGYRGHSPADLAAIEDVLLRVSKLVEEIPEIVELDLNPVMALPPGQGCRIVDARVRVEPAR